MTENSCGNMGNGVSDKKILVDEQCTGDKGTSLVHSNSCIVTCAISLIYLKSNLALSSLSTYPYL